MRGELGFYLHRTTPSVNESHVASSEIFPLFESTVRNPEHRDTDPHPGHLEEQKAR